MTDKSETTPKDPGEIANEITAAARAARETAERAESMPQANADTKWPIGKIGIGIGSAALAAAVIYAARRKPKN